MVECKDVIVFFIVLLIGALCMLGLLWWIGVDHYIQDTVTAMAGGVFGGAAYVFWEKAFLKK
jgi:hypothetical protein